MAKITRNMVRPYTSAAMSLFLNENIEKEKRERGGKNIRIYHRIIAE